MPRLIGSLSHEPRRFKLAARSLRQIFLGRRPCEPEKKSRHPSPPFPGPDGAPESTDEMIYLDHGGATDRLRRFNGVGMAPSDSP